MALLIAVGSNIGDRFEHLADARKRLAARWRLTAASRVYLSAAVDYLDQPEFANQVLQFALPWETPSSVMARLLEVEREMGRVRGIPKGPRIIDIDLLFWGLTSHCEGESLTIPHPRWRDRSFVVRPLAELPFFHALEKCHTIPTSFDVEAVPVDL